MSSLWSSVEAVRDSPLLRRALVGCLLVGALGGVVGVHVSLRRLSFTAMALTHATFPGVVLAALLGWNLTLGSAAFGVVVVLVLALLGNFSDLDHTSSAGVMLAGGIALGVVLASASDGLSRDLSGFLVGSVLATSTGDVVATAAWGVGLCVLLAVLHRPLVASAFDPVGTRSAGLPVGVIDLVMLVVLMTAISVMVPSVGTILSVALLVAPTAAARMWTTRIGVLFVASPLLGAMCGAVGLILSHWADTAAGATIAVTCGGLFALSVTARVIVQTGRARQVRAPMGA